MLLYSLGEHHLTYEMHAALPARRASPHIRNACCFARSASITSHTRPASTLFSSNARIPRHRPCRPHRLRHPHLLLHRLFPHLHLSNPTESPTVAVLAAIATAVALTALTAVLATLAADEFRLSETSLNEVIPEPSTGLLVVLGLSGLLLKRRKTGTL